MNDTSSPSVTSCLALETTHTEDEQWNVRDECFSAAAWSRT